MGKIAQACEDTRESLVDRLSSEGYRHLNPGTPMDKIQLYIVPNTNYQLGVRLMWNASGVISELHLDKEKPDLTSRVHKYGVERGMPIVDSYSRNRDWTIVDGTKGIHPEMHALRKLHGHTPGKEMDIETITSSVYGMIADLRDVVQAR